MAFTRWNKIRSFTEKNNNKYSVYFMLLTHFGRSFKIKIQYSSFPLFPVAYPFRVATQLQYYVKREKCKVSDVIFPSSCEARAINLGNKNMKIGIFNGGTIVRSIKYFHRYFSISYRKAWNKSLRCIILTSKLSHDYGSVNSILFWTDWIPKWTGSLTCR